MTAAKGWFVLALALLASSAIHALEEESAPSLEPTQSSGALSAEFCSHGIMSLLCDNIYHFDIMAPSLFGFIRQYFHFQSSLSLAFEVNGVIADR